MNLLTEIFSGGVRGSTSIAYAALGETISERAGVVNLGTEGCMLAGACAGYAVAAQSGSPWLGAVGGAVAGGLLSLVMAFFVLSRGANQLATGLVVLFLALGLTSVFGVTYVSQTITPFEIIDVMTDARRAMSDDIIVTPTLVGSTGRLRMVIVGDLADETKLRTFLSSLTSRG